MGSNFYDDNVTEVIIFEVVSDVIELVKTLLTDYMLMLLILMPFFIFCMCYQSRNLNPTVF